MDLIERALRLADQGEENREIAVVYALAAVVSQLESIDDALRNTIGGNPR
jgi:hypothetical protein